MGRESVSQFEQHFLIQASKQTIFTLLYNQEEMHEHIPDLGTFVAIERVDNTSFNYICVVLDKDIKINTLCLWNFFNMVMWPSCTFYNSAYNTIRCDKKVKTNVTWFVGDLTEPTVCSMYMYLQMVQ